MSRITCLVTGFWPTAVNNGLDDIAHQLSIQDPGRVVIVKKYYDDLVSAVKGFDLIDLVGHSFGGNACVDAATGLGKIVSNLVLLDPVHYWWWGGDFEIPVNVVRCLCLKKSFGLPPSVGIVQRSILYSATVIPTLDHGGFPAIPEVASAVIKFLA